MRLKGVESGALQALSTRLAKVRFDMNSDSQVIGVDRHPDKLTVEIALRREREGLAFDDAKSTLVAQKGYEYSRRLLTLDAAAGIGCTPNSKRDLAQFAELLKKCGAPQAEFLPLLVDLAAWTREFLRYSNDTAQLAQVIVDSFYAEPKLIGRFAAKTVDNRLELKLLTELAGKLRSIRLSYFYEGVRRTVEARADGVLSCTSTAEEDLEGFFDEQTRLYLKFAVALEKDSGA